MTSIMEKRNEFLFDNKLENNIWTWEENLSKELKFLHCKHYMHDTASIVQGTNIHGAANSFLGLERMLQPHEKKKIKYKGEQRLYIKYFNFV